jgi:hypothetical protein
MAGDGPPLEAGFGRRSLVTERRGVTLGGYGGRGLIPALGVHDPTYARAVVLRTPGRAVALVALDLIGVQRTIHDALARRGFPPRVRLGADDVVIVASHTHSGYGSLAKPVGAPLLDGLFLVTCGPFDPGFLDEVVEKVRAAIIDAWDDLAPSRAGVGSEEVIPPLARNRGRPGGAVDPEVGVVKVTDLAGRVRGVIVNFAAHPVILGADNLYLSADYPGALARHLELHYPGAMALFTQGAEGDQSPRVPDAAPEGDGWGRLEAVGARLAGRVVRIVDATPTAGSMGIDVKVVERDMPEPSGFFDRWKFRGGAVRRTLFSELVLGDALFMGIPGEPCCRIGLDLKAAARARGFRRAFVLGLALDHCGYFVHAADYAPGLEASHAYEKRLNFYGPGIGAFFVEVHGPRFGLAPLPTRGLRRGF